MHKITVMGTSDKLKYIINDDYIKIILRTEVSAAAELLKSRGVEFKTLDFIYEGASDFDELDEMLAHKVIEVARETEVIYVVPGSAVTGDGSVKEIEKLYERVEIVPGDAPEYELLSAIFDADVAGGYSVVPASCLERGAFSAHLPLVITCLDNEYLLSDVKLLLTEEYGDSHFVYIGKGEKYSKVKLYEIDRFEEIDHDTMLYVPKKTKTSRYDFWELENVFIKLRSPEGCPWDREQDHVSLKRYLLEECAEVLDAIDGGDMHELMDELGDVLLQILFHATIAAERGDFDIRDIVDNLARKLIRRHPHVFADTKAENSEEVLKQWDEIKHEEKEDKSVAGKLKSVPKSMTALMRAQKVISRAAKTDFFTDKQNDAKTLIERLRNDLEILETLEDESQAEIPIGDLFFNAANLSRVLKVESEIALHDKTRKFIEEIKREESKNK